MTDGHATADARDFARDVCVEDGDLERAHGVLKEAQGLSDEELERAAEEAMVA